MKKIYAYKIVVKKDRILIYCDALNPDLKEIYGDENLKTELDLPLESVKKLRGLFDVHNEVSNMFWIERTLRKHNGIQQIMHYIRLHKLKYQISAYTLCSTRQK